MAVYIPKIGAFEARVFEGDRSSARIDELEASLATVLSPHDESQALADLAWELRFRDRPKARRLGERAVALAALGESTRRASSLRSHIAASSAIAHVELYEGNIASAIARCLEAKSLLHDQSTPEAAKVEHVLGWCNYFLGNHPEALENALHGLAIARDCREDSLIGWSLDEVASFLAINGDLEYSSRLHEEAIQIFTSLGEIVGEMCALNNYAVCLNNAGKPSEALGRARLSIELARRLGDKIATSVFICSLADILEALGRQEEALASLGEAEPQGSDMATVAVFMRLGKGRLLSRDFDAASRKAGEAIAIAESAGMRDELAEGKRLLSEIYERYGQFEDALRSFKEYHRLQQETQSDKNAERLAAMQVKHQIEDAKRSADINRLEALEWQHKVEEQEQKNSVLETQASTDPLTGLRNRRYLEEALAREYSRHSHSGLDLAILMIDIDWFKAYNDTYGHLRGDECLKEVASVIAHGANRPADVAARYGGEEFVCILPDTGITGALEVAEGIRREVDARAIPHALSLPTGTVSVSIGIASGKCSKRGSSKDLVEQADARLYLAKSRGRNMVVGD